MRRSKYIKANTQNFYEDVFFRLPTDRAVYVIQVVAVREGFVIEGGFRKSFLTHAVNCESCKKVADCIESAIANAMLEFRVHTGQVKKQ
jgi:hypothetical protein